MSGPRVQHPAPNFKGTAVVNGEFKDIQLSDYKGKYLVLFFYPLDLLVLIIYFYFFYSILIFLVLSYVQLK